MECDRGYMVAYDAKIPGTSMTFRMVPAPGGVAPMPGDPSGSTKVRLAPYWIAAHEVTWAEYWRYMELDTSFGRLEALRAMLGTKGKDAETLRSILKQSERLATAVAAKAEEVDGVTAPTPLYDPSATYESGQEPGLPAVTMSPFAARQYTKWLSVISGVDYRLPSEAEWEHAARAGGGDYGAGAEQPVTADNLGDYAWTTDNSDYVAHLVGKKKPNAWGLYDVLGNAAEWVLDGAGEEDLEGDAADGGDQDAATDPPKTLAWSEAVRWPTGPSARIAKGGFYDAEVEDCRVESRLVSEAEEWKGSDPNIPLSPWWFTDYPATGTGMRIVRPLKPMTAEVKRRAWEIDHPSIRNDVEKRIGGGDDGEGKGQGKRDWLWPGLPGVRAELESREIQKLLN
ncbi:MAG: SUMF1/EgtB/PvdO family nonheme iron enzyme [Planctomycetota bacterium]